MEQWTRETWPSYRPRMQPKTGWLKRCKLLWTTSCLNEGTKLASAVAHRNASRVVGAELNFGILSPFHPRGLRAPRDYLSSKQKTKHFQDFCAIFKCALCAFSLWLEIFYAQICKSLNPLRRNGFKAQNFQYRIGNERENAHSAQFPVRGNPWNILNSLLNYNIS